MPSGCLQCHSSKTHECSPPDQTDADCPAALVDWMGDVLATSSLCSTRFLIFCSLINKWITAFLNATIIEIIQNSRHKCTSVQKGYPVQQLIFTALGVCFVLTLATERVHVSRFGFLINLFLFYFGDYVLMCKLWLSTSCLPAFFSLCALVFTVICSLAPVCFPLICQCVCVFILHLLPVPLVFLLCSTWLCGLIPALLLLSFWTFLGPNLNMLLLQKLCSVAQGQCALCYWVSWLQNNRLSGCVLWAQCIVVNANLSQYFMPE